jgi:hypothetical protein
MFMPLPLPTTQLNEEEIAISDKLLDVYYTIVGDWELNCNSGELAHAVHTIQLFIMKHAFQRNNDSYWSSEWYGKEDVNAS